MRTLPYAMFLYLLLFMKAKYLLTTPVTKSNHPGGEV